MPKVGFIGLGNVGGKLAEPFLAGGANWADSPAEMAHEVDILITCLPNPLATAAVLDSAISASQPATIWAEMSTTDQSEVLKLASLLKQQGVDSIDCPVSGGCHRAATGNISILAVWERSVFDRMLPILSIMGRQILHTGELGSASILKVVTNYLATANLVSLCEALVTSKTAGMVYGHHLQSNPVNGSIEVPPQLTSLISSNFEQE